MVQLCWLMSGTSWGGRPAGTYCRRDNICWLLHAFGGSSTDVMIVQIFIAHQLVDIWNSLCASH
jgi:hypothetical protein